MCWSVRAWWWRGALLGTMMLLSWTWPVVEGCPNMCTCKWKSGKEWVECANRDLKGLPQGAREETQVLDLSNNHLVSLPPECFHALGLINLQRLYLSRSHISRIAARAFVGLVGLVELDLSENLIEEIPSETFPSYSNLMKLLLNGNPIREIRVGAFQHLPHLTNLELSHCRLENIEQGAFDGLHLLEWLRLDGNRLTRVPERTLPLGGSLRGLTLHNNPWVCDCRLQATQAWLKESAPAAPQESDPICDAPAKLRGKQIKTVNELACLPRIELQNRVEAYEGDNVTLKCDVYAVPAAKLTWWFNGELCELQNENDTLSASSATTFPRYVYRQRGGINTSSTLLLYSVETLNEGTYTCIAENGAGSAEANLSLRVLFQEKITVEPPNDRSRSGYVVAIAAGALLGTLFALGSLIGSIVFCVRKRRRDRKRNSKALVSQNKSVMPITKDTATSLPCRKGNGSLIGLEHEQMVSYTERELNRAATLERREHRNLEEPYCSPVSKYLTEPDLINEVPETTDVGYGQLYRHQPGDRQILEYDSGYPLQPDLRPANIPQLSYLDQDGYPLNFGLPKIPFSAASTLPRLRQRMPVEGSAVAPPARYSREAEFLARSPGYDPVLPRTDTRYTADGYPYPAQQSQPIQPVEQPIQQQQQLPVSPVSPVAVFPEVPFIPSPPAAYRGETTPLSPRSLLSKTAREAAAAAAARADDLQPPHHPESPDEGYVGDAMDV